PPAPSWAGSHSKDQHLKFTTASGLPEKGPRLNPGWCSPQPSDVPGGAGSPPPPQPPKPPPPRGEVWLRRAVPVGSRSPGPGAACRGTGAGPGHPRQDAAARGAASAGRAGQGEELGCPGAGLPWGRAGGAGGTA
ncbi:unnamed protein product, partial [Bubo scandiacus]